jgi:hypothetical protein
LLAARWVCWEAGAAYLRASKELALHVLSHVSKQCKEELIAGESRPAGPEQARSLGEKATSRPIALVGLSSGAPDACGQLSVTQPGHLSGEERNMPSHPASSWATMYSVIKRRCSDSRASRSFGGVVTATTDSTRGKGQRSATWRSGDLACRVVVVFGTESGGRSRRYRG